MKIINKLYVALSITLMGLNEALAVITGTGGGTPLSPSGPATTNGPGVGSIPVPEMDSSIAALGLGLAMGLAALISEYNRR